MKKALIFVGWFVIYAFPAWAQWGPAGFDVRITNAANDSLYPSLVWNSNRSQYGVSWVDYRDSNGCVPFVGEIERRILLGYN